MENAPVVKEETNLTNLAGPETALAYAQRCSKALMDVVRQCDLAKNFGGKKDHIEYEGWGMIAEFYGCSIGAEEAMPIGEPDSDGTYKGYRAKGYVKRNDDGAILATADSSCSRDEKNWRNKPDYQLMSMAQTRAGSKAARMKFSWIAALAGFSATPAEEMVGEFESRKPKTVHKEEPPDDLPEYEPVSQSEAQARHRRGELKTYAKKDNDAYFTTIGQHGATNAEEIVTTFNDEQYAALIKDLKKACK